MARWGVVYEAMKYKPKKKNILLLEQYLQTKLNEKLIKKHKEGLGN